MKLTIRLARRFAGIIFVCGCLVTLLASRDAWGQDMSTGAVTVTVQDPAGAAVNGAQLALKDLDTNAVRTAKTQGSGSAVFPDLNFGHYTLTITKDGFATKVYSSVLVQTNQVTPVNARLSMGNISQQVTVSAESSPILDTSSNTLSTTVDLKEVQDLPVFARDTFPLAFLVPGAANGGLNSSDETFNGLAGGALNASLNGFSDISARWKSSGIGTYNATGVAVPRLEDTQEMTVQTGELDASKGGNSAMDIGFVTKRGTNKFHGLLFEDYRNDWLNANSWINNATGIPRAKLIINDFGGSLGGPILKDKLFFFASLANYRQPVDNTVSTEVPSALAAQGIYQYYPTLPNGSTGSTLQSINVLQEAANAGYPGVINPVIAPELQAVQNSYKYGQLSFFDPNHNTLSFTEKQYNVQRYPTARLDYNLTQNFRLTGVFNETYQSYIGGYPGPYPGPAFADLNGSSLSKGYQAVTGFDWNITPNVLNALRIGYLYNTFFFDTEAAGVNPATLSNQYWSFGLNSGVEAITEGGQSFPVLSLKDDTTWQRGAHTIMFGGEVSTEIDHYYNAPSGFLNTGLGVATGDPVSTPLVNSVPSDAPASVPSDIEGLYATLTGRIDYLNEQRPLNVATQQYTAYGSFNLHERLTNSALFAQDSWKVRPDLTLNYGLRWDFIGADMDETGDYTSPSLAGLWGPSGVNNLFNPGVFNGEANPVARAKHEAYNPSYVHPEPEVGFAWNPQDTEGLLGKLLGGGNNVIRGSYTFKNYTEGQQNFWNFASDSGLNFYAQANAFPAATTGPGFFTPGSLSLGGALPALLQSPASFSPVLPESSLTFNGFALAAFNPNIKQPWVESWELGIQHQFNQNNVLEVRYVGNVSKNQWLAYDINEINIFENGFLKEFQKAQANLSASGGTTLRGAQPLPILSQAFAATEPGNFSNGQFITDVQQGQAGALANAIAGNPGYFCSLVGAGNFGPCAAAGASGTGTYPTNFFQVNPFGTGQRAFELDADGYSNYNAMQVDFRQRPTHGMEFDVNYTLAHTLSLNQTRSIAPGFYSNPAYYTLRDKHMSYGPSPYDIRHTLHASGTYDLPFGHGRTFLNQNRLEDIAVGGWTFGTIMGYQSGPPIQFFGQTNTVNINDSGIVLTGVTPSQLQHAIGIHRVPGQPRVDYINPKYISSQGQANNQYISPEFTAGQFGRVLYLYGPKFITTDMALTKVVPIRDNWTFSLQGEFLNVFNHPAWSGQQGDSGVQDNTFGTIYGTGLATGNSIPTQPRNIELRANFQF